MAKTSEGTAFNAFIKTWRPKNRAEAQRFDEDLHAVRVETAETIAKSVKGGK